MNISDDAVPIRKLDDSTLIQKFVEGESSLLSNQTLRVETSFDAIALMAKKEGVVATIKEVARKRTILVRYKSQYWQLVHSALLTQSFIPTNYPDQQGFIQYCRHEIPPGYQVNYAEARFLWKEWWMQRRKYTTQSIQLDILIFTRDKWYPVREIISNEGVLFITTLVGDTILSGSDQIAWLNRIPKPGTTPGVVGQLQARQVLQPNEVTTSDTILEQAQSMPPGSATSASSQDREAEVPTLDLSNPLSAPSITQPTRPPFIPGLPGREVGATRMPGRASLPLSSGSTKKLPDLDDVQVVSPGQPLPPPAAARVEETTTGWVDVPTQPAEVYPSASETLQSNLSMPVVQTYPDVAPLVDIGAVLRFGQGRLYISTAIGELVVEGADLKFWLTRSSEPS